MGWMRKYLHAKDSSPLDRAKSCWGHCAWEFLGISFGLLVPLLHPGFWQQQEEREFMAPILWALFFVCLFVFCLMSPFHCPVLAWACLFCSRQPGRFLCVPPWALPAGENQVWEQRSLVTALAKRSLYWERCHENRNEIIFRDCSVSHHRDKSWCRASNPGRH